MEKLRKLMQVQFDKMIDGGKPLFRSSVDSKKLWDGYIKGFENDPIFRDPNSSVHTCNHCNNFIRRYGNIVSINDKLEIETIFDVELEKDSEYFVSFEKMRNVLKKNEIESIFVETYENLVELPYESVNRDMKTFKLGIPTNHKEYDIEEIRQFPGTVELGKVYTFQHFSLNIPSDYISFSDKSIESIVGDSKNKKHLLSKCMEQIPLDVLELSKDLVIQGSLLDSEDELPKVDEIITIKTNYDSIKVAKKRELYLWVMATQTPYYRFANTLLGVFCGEYIESGDLTKTCKVYNIRRDPENFMRATAPLTTNQRKMAEDFVVENGYVESFNRRYATLDDIKVTDIKHINNDNKTSVSIFGDLPVKENKSKKADFDKVESVTIDKFMEKILPTCDSIEVFLENKHQGNMLTLTTSATDDSKRIFKWDNNYVGTFNGNLAGKSRIATAVKEKGGNIDGIIRFSLIWNETKTGLDTTDLDAWCKEPGGTLIGYTTPFRKDRNPNSFSPCGGQLDLDETGPRYRLGVENIYYTDTKNLRPGRYKFHVNMYANRGFKGFKVELTAGTQVRYYEYNDTQVYDGTNIMVAEVEYTKNGEFIIHDILPCTSFKEDSIDLYGLKTGQFHKVDLVCLSPNHWGDNSYGNKYYYFMLNGCINPNPLRTFHVENLNSDLMTHKKVMEYLGQMRVIEPKGEKQLSGVGFNSTVRESLVVKVNGSHSRVLRIEF